MIKEDYTDQIARDLHAFRFKTKYEMGFAGAKMPTYPRLSDYHQYFYRMILYHYTSQSNDFAVLSRIQIIGSPCMRSKASVGPNLPLANRTHAPAVVWFDL